MHASDFWHSAVAFAAGFLAGGINVVAGGGTLITFPTLIWLGLNSITANATSTVALWPFVIGGFYGYRRELKEVEGRMMYLVIPSVVGGLGGALLLKLTPETVFSRLVPYLILFATLLFMAQGWVQRKFDLTNPESHRSPKWFVCSMLFQLLVGLYGGYFGAGIGIMMLAALSLLGMTEIHQMNAMKNVLGGAINFVAAIYFIAEKMVYWPDTAVMAVGAIAGGYLGTSAARKAGPRAVSATVIVVGFGMAISLFIKH